MESDFQHQDSNVGVGAPGVTSGGVSELTVAGVSDRLLVFNGDDVDITMKVKFGMAQADARAYRDSTNLFGHHQRIAAHGAVGVAIGTVGVGEGDSV